MTSSIRHPDFIDFLWRSGVITFGDFVAKSGRPTPYFVDAGKLGSAAQMSTVGGFYAAAIATQFGDDVNVIFGPAYKGIGLALSAGIALYRDHGRNVGVTFDRKEAKDHGEGGWLVGHRPVADDRIVIVEDVTTAGTSIRATVPSLTAIEGVEVVGLVVGVDRQERGDDHRPALAQLADTYALRTYALATISEVVAHLDDQISAADRQRIDDYRRTYGA